MKRISSIVMAWIVISMCAFVKAQNNQVANIKRPNIVLVITDDQGKNDLGCEGNPYIKTPHLDKFHAGAVRLTNFHVSTTCAPSRGALMTGRHTNRLNVFHTIAGAPCFLRMRYFYRKYWRKTATKTVCLTSDTWATTTLLDPKTEVFMKWFVMVVVELPKALTTGEMIILTTLIGTTETFKLTKAIARMSFFQKLYILSKPIKTNLSSVISQPMHLVARSIVQRNTWICIKTNPNFLIK